MAQGESKCVEVKMYGTNNTSKIAELLEKGGYTLSRYPIVKSRVRKQTGE
jgi:hypothetical protein